MWYICTMEYYLAIKKQNNAIGSNMDATRDNFTKWSKPEREGQIPYYHLYVEYKIWHKWTYIQNGNRFTDVEKTCGCQWSRGDWLGVWGYIMFRMDKQQIPTA